MAFDGIVIKKIVDELQPLKNYKIDKIFEPDKNTIVIGLYGNFSNLALLICVSPNNYRIHLTSNGIKNPNIAPNFCMLLRKHILGYKIKNIYSKGLERIVFIDIENNENLNKPIKKRLVIELMGKHSNIILLDHNGIVIDSLRHTFVEKNAQRDIYPTARYLEPNTNKKNILEVNNFEDFYSKLDLKDNDDILEKIVNTFNGISITNLKHIDNTVQSGDYSSIKLYSHIVFDNLLKILKSKNLTIETILKNGSPSDFYLVEAAARKDLSLNYSLDDFYFKKENNELFKNYRNTLLSIILSTLKKYEKRLDNIDSKLEECRNMDKYKLYGELLTSNLYRIPNYNISSIKLENYYDNNNLIEIPLDKSISPQYNANRFYKKYSKLKNALEIVGKQKEETKEEIKYIESIVYELDDCSKIEDIQEVYDEISSNDVFKLNKNTSKQKNNSKPKKTTSNKFATFNPLKYTIDDYTIYVGRNNKENDYLTNKFASKTDLWFHTKEVHGSHVILKANLGEKIPENIILYAAKLAAKHSKAKNSSNVPVDYCLVQYVKKVPGNKPGLVIYKNNKTIYV